MSGLIRERDTTFRIIIAVSIFTGLQMRKNFCAKINALFAFRSYDYIFNLNESLQADDSIKFILTKYGGSMVGLQRARPDLAEKYPIWPIMNEKNRIEQFFEDDSIIVYSEDDLGNLLLKYPFLPAKITRLDDLGTSLLFYFPIVKQSPLLPKIYKSLHRAYDTGIADYILKEMKLREQRKLVESHTYEKVLNIYHQSKYFRRYGNQTKEADREKNVFTLCSYLAIIGFVQATVFLMREIYLDACFGRKR